MSLYLIQANVQLGPLYRWAGRRQLMPTAFDEGYALHCLLNGSFGEGVFRPFRLMSVRGASEASLYGYSTLNVDELENAAASYAEPEFSTIVAQLKSKQMPESFSTGRTLGFDLKIRPVRRNRLKEGGSPQERDAYQVAAMAQGAVSGATPSALSREDVYLKWLVERLSANGAELNPQRNAKLVSFQRVLAIRRAGQRKGTEGPEAIIQGEITVTDSALFQQLLHRGVGRHCAYGYGMLLLRPPRQAN